MLRAKTTQPESLAEHLDQLRDGVADFDELNKDDYLIRDHEPSAFVLILQIVGLASVPMLWVAYGLAKVFANSAVIEYSLLSMAIVSAFAVFLAERRGKKRHTCYNVRVRVALGAVIMAHVDCYDPEAELDAGGALVASDDPEVEANPTRLIWIVDRINELRSGDLDSVPDDIRPLCEWLNNDASPGNPYEHRFLPEWLAGGNRIWVQCAIFSRDRLPKTVLDRPLLPFLWDAEDVQVCSEIPPLDLWWWPEVDSLFYAHSDFSENEQQQGGEKEVL